MSSAIAFLVYKTMTSQPAGGSLWLSCKNTSGVINRTYPAAFRGSADYVRLMVLLDARPSLSYIRDDDTSICVSIVFTFFMSASSACLSLLASCQSPVTRSCAANSVLVCQGCPTLSRFGGPSFRPPISCSSARYHVVKHACINTFCFYRAKPSIITGGGNRTCATRNMKHHVTRTLLVSLSCLLMTTLHHFIICYTFRLIACR